MRCFRPGLVVLVSLIGLAAFIYAILVAGCGSGTPSNFGPAANVQVEPGSAAAVGAWMRAQEAGDQDALQALYDPVYEFNGMTADDMAEVRVLPETPDTQVDSLEYRFIPPTSQQPRYLNRHPHHLVSARVTTTGKVAADYVRHLASGEPGGHTHEHSGEVALQSDESLPGHVSARSTWDVEWEFVEDNTEYLIVRQQIIKGELRLGNGVSNPLIDAVHVHPDDPGAGESVEVHGHYAALPPGGMIRVSIGHHQADAVLDTGHFQAEVEAPHEAGDYVARVEAFGGSTQSRTAALTTLEEEVTVE